MSKSIIRMIIVSIAVVTIYCLIVFLIPFQRNANFWISFVFTLISLIVAGYAIYIGFFTDRSATSRFYGFPVARIGCIYCLTQLAIGFVFMAISLLVPWWVVALICGLTLCLGIVGLISSEAVRDEIKVQDDVIGKRVTFMRGLQSKVNQIYAQCVESEVAESIRTFAEEIKYSDPVSSEGLMEIEADLSAIVSDLQSAVVEGEKELVCQLCNNAMAILAERNRLCKLNK